MNIKIEYEPTAKELAKASSLFAEKKPFLLYSVGLVNALAGLFVFIFLLKLVVVGFLNLHEWLAAFACCLWLFGRRPFNQWILYQKMKRSIVLGKPMTIDVSRNGISWSGKGLRQGSMTWDQVKYIMETQNGFILPNSFTKFLWLPLRGFQSPQDIDNLRKLIIEFKIVHRVYAKWKC